MLDIRNLYKVFPAARGGNAVVAIDGLSLSVAQGELFTLLGPSGCGKTTTLRCVAGLERADRGEIALGSTPLFSGEENVNVPSNRRGLGMVFQSYAIWPHMTVLQNVAFPLRVLPRRQRPAKSEIRERVERALSVVQLEGLENRRATDLSGGQQQRLALARALVIQPPLLLLDEPLSNLDAKLREDMRFELKRLQRELGLTALYVTHDQVEALAMSNVIAVMNAGDVEQVGKPREIYERPASHFVADFIGTSNFLAGRVETAAESGIWLVSTQHGRLPVRSDRHLTEGSEVTVSIRPEHIALANPEPSSSGARSIGHWSGRVTARAFVGEAVDHLVDVGGTELRVRCNPSVSFAPGSSVSVQIASSGTTAIPTAS